MKKNKKKSMNPTEKVERDDRLTLEGQVTEATGGTMFRVQLDSGPMIVATLSGRMRQHRIRILPGDTVTLEVSPYDMTRGRIVWRRKD